MILAQHRHKHQTETNNKYYPIKRQSVWIHCRSRRRW